MAQNDIRECEHWVTGMPVVCLRYTHANLSPLSEEKKDV